MEIINGKNFYNNDVVVDFSTHKVRFSPHVNVTFFHHYLISSMPLMIILFYFLLITCILVYQPEFRMSTIPEIILMFLRYLIWAILIGFLANTAFLYKPWRDRCFPRFNAFNVTIAGIIQLDLSTILGIIGRQVKPKHLIGNVFILPRFSNVFLKYELYGDFKKIKRIDVHSFDKHKGKRFYAIFDFDMPIKDGYMKISWI